MTEPQAKSYAAAALSTEANELAGWLDATRDNKEIYHRVRIAVRTEMTRLREIASVLTSTDL